MQTPRTIMARDSGGDVRSSRYAPGDGASVRIRARRPDDASVGFGTGWRVSDDGSGGGADFVIEASGRVVGLLVVEHPDPCFLDLQLVGMDPDAFALELGSALAAWVDAYCEDHSVGLLMLRARDGLSADPKRWKSQRMCVARGLDALQQLPGLCGWVRSYPILIQISRADCVAHAPGAPSLASLCRSLDVAVAG